MSKSVRQIRIEGDIAYVPLTRGLEAIVDASDAELVRHCNWYVMIAQHGHAYATRAPHRGSTDERMMHRAIMSPPKGMVVDHIDGDGLNNRRANLRVCTQRQNTANQVVMRRNRLGVKGVRIMESARYQASIQVDGRTIHLGMYDTAEEAGAAYKGASRLLYGEFAK